MPQLASELGERYRCIAMDMPGHGGSDAAPEPERVFSARGLVSMITGVVSALHCTEPVLVGHSLGGHLAIEALPHLPGCGGVLIWGAPPLRSVASMAEAFLPGGTADMVFKECLGEEDVKRFVRSCGDTGGELADEGVEWVKATQPAFRSSLGRSALRGEMGDEVAIVESASCPVAIVHGAAESVVSLPYISSLAIPALWRGAVQVIPGGHFCHREHPAVFNRIVGDFLDEIAG
jgi:pimeloyl-ACP methyl ester carboxylesterase